MTLAEAALALRETLALPAPEPVAAEVRHLETGADFVLRRIEYRGDEDDLIPALLFVPRGRERCAGALVHY